MKFFFRLVSKAHSKLEVFDFGKAPTEQNSITFNTYYITLGPDLKFKFMPLRRLKTCIVLTSILHT